MKIKITCSLRIYTKIIKYLVKQFEIKKSSKKQLVSTSRHISQGGFDLENVWLDEDGKLHGRSKVVAGEPYVITVYDPDKEYTFDEVLHPEITGEIDWCIG